MSRKGNFYQDDYDYDYYDDDYYDDYDDYDDSYKARAQPKKSTPKKPANPNISKQMEKVQITPKSKQGKSTPAKNLLEEHKKERANDKSELSMVVVGHVDAGKSTLMGHLLLQCGQVSQEEVHKYEQESRKMNKASFKLAWVMDSGEEERRRGITMDIAHSTFETGNYKVNIMDAPGHSDFVPNMISGTSQADVALLVVASQHGEFESGFKKGSTGFNTGGQTREHLSIVRSLGISQIVVAVNKLDCVDYNQSRYDEIVGKLKFYIENECGFHSNNVKYVPVSGLHGNNIMNRCNQIDQWYTGPTLVKAIDQFKSPSRNLEHPFRFVVSNVYKPAQTSGLCVDGKVVAGGIMTKNKISVMPSKETGLVKKIEVDGVGRKVAVSGQQCTLVLSGVKNDDHQVTPGCVVCSDKQICRVSKFVKARIIVLDTKVPLTMGTKLQLHYNLLNIPATIAKIKCSIDKDTGHILVKKPKNIGKNEGAAIKLQLHSTICVELYEKLNRMGRFTLRYSNNTVARGIITKIY